MGRWKKGQSGNPSGRPVGALNKSTREIKEILEEAVDFDKIIKKLQDRALKGNERAAEILLAYRYGKPTQREEAMLRSHTMTEEEAEEARKKAEEALKLMETEELEEKLLSRLKLSNVAGTHAKIA